MADQARSTFVDRTAEYRLIEEHLALLRADPGHLAVFAVAGLGGMGKSRFLAEVSSRFAALADPPTLIWVSLDDEASMSATAPLLAIRNQLPVDCALFDVALLTYWDATEQPRQRIVDGLAVRALAAGGELARLSLPLAYGADVFAAMEPETALRLGYDRAEFARIDALRDSPAELSAKLPGYLGLDIHRRLRNPDARSLIFFYDGYEKQADRTLAEGAPWLRRFIGSLQGGIHLIAARDGLEWDEREWGKVVRRLELRELPEEECRKMIRRELGDHLRRDVEDKLVAASGQIAFFLHTSIDVCRAEVSAHGRVRSRDLPSSPPAALERLLDHLGDAQRRLTVLLAAVQYFDEPLYGHLIRSFDVAAVLDLSEFVEWFFVTDVGRGLFRTHDLLTDAVRTAGDETTKDALGSATAQLVLRTRETVAGDGDRLPQLFHALVEAWQSVEAMPEADAERLFDIGYNLFDSGYWRGLANLPVLEGGEPHAARLAALYFAALTTRRTHGPARALEQLEPLTASRGLMGRHAGSFEVERAYLNEIRGDYRLAREEFQALLERAVPFDPTRRDHVRARLYHGDMLLMDGRFAEAARLLLEAYEDVGTSSRLAWAELVRHRGHAHRFSLVYDTAEQLYLQALDAVRDTPAMNGKLRTNLAEARCWLEPDRAVHDAEQAIELNRRLGNQIEVAKAHSAKAVALGRLGHFDAARRAAREALREAADVDYPAAQCFAKQALVAIDVWAGGSPDTEYGELVDGVRSLGTYGHLCIVPAWLRGDDAERARWSRDVDWIEAPALEARLEVLRGP
jgi:tetratricopeptide (TPR) repeat protein